MGELRLPFFIWVMIGNMQAFNQYQAIIAVPFGVVGILCDFKMLAGIDFLAPEILLHEPEDKFTENVCKQLDRYFKDPCYEFSLPFSLNGSAHQKKVWQVLSKIPCGQTRQYGELAQELSSSPRAVGQACGANPIPIVVPCHRVVSKNGIGGFAHQRNGYELDIKKWLLSHEQC